MDTLVTGTMLTSELLGAEHSAGSLAPAPQAVPPIFQRVLLPPLWLAKI
jgi:hypothetical protein